MPDKSNKSHESATPRKEVVVDKSHVGKRLDKALQDMFPGASFGMVRSLCRKGQVRVDGSRVKGGEKLKEGQTLRIPPAFYNLEAEVKGDEPLTLSNQERDTLKKAIIYKDEALLILNKPAGIPVQAGSGHSRSLDRLMAAIYPNTPPKLTHRLDRDTSGCLVMAFTSQAAKSLTAQFKYHEVQKTYWAIACGTMHETSGVIDFKVEKGGAPGKERMHITEKGQEAETAFRRIAHRKGANWVELKPKTGRTHQIRTHLAAMGTPVLGDAKYGGKDAKQGPEGPVQNLFLHARHVAFKHPESGQDVAFTAPIPKHFDVLFQRMKWQEKNA